MWEIRVICKLIIYSFKYLLVCFFSISIFTVVSSVASPEETEDAVDAEATAPGGNKIEEEPLSNSGQ